MIRLLTTTAVAILGVVLSTSVLAQIRPAPPPAPAAPATAQPATSPAQPPPFTAGWQNGFQIQSADGLNRLQVGLLIHADAGFAFDDPAHTLTNTFIGKRVRPYLRGRIADRFEFYLNPDFAGGVLVVQDAYVDTRFSTAFRLRIGKAKVPFGHERLQSASNLLFLERAFPTSIAPNRDVGLQLIGDVVGGTVSYLAGVQNGTPDGASVDLDTNDAKEVAGRLVVRPFSRTPTSVLAGLGFALSGSSGKQTGAAALPTYRTGVIRQAFFSYTGSTADGTRNRYSPYVFYYYKAFGGFGEYVRSELPVRKGNVREEIAHAAWQVATSLVLTGEAASEAGVRPRANFDFGNGHWGAIQLAFRVHGLVVEEDAITLGLATPGSSREATAWTTGLNWYLNLNIKYAFNFERVVFDDDPSGPRKPENVFAFRTQLNF
jgi:phosphate-selective porin OprO/OprP